MTGWGGLFVFLLFIIGVALSIAMIVAPLVIPVLVFYGLRRFGAGLRQAAFWGTAPPLALLAWPLSGLVELRAQCEETSIVRSSTERLGPIDTLLVDGPGMWDLDKKIAVERAAYRTREGKTEYVRREPGKGTDKPNIVPVSTAALRSSYRVTIERPQGGDIRGRYLTSTAIKIEDRTTGELVASVREAAWGGGLAGAYIGAIAGLNPFAVNKRYLSCGYAGKEPGIFRDSSNERGRHYRSADQNLIEKIFILPAAN